MISMGAGVSPAAEELDSSTEEDELGTSSRDPVIGAGVPSEVETTVVGGGVSMAVAAVTVGDGVSGVPAIAVEDGEGVVRLPVDPVTDL